MKQGMRSISIEEWHGLCLSGIAPSVQIYLDGSSMRPLIRRGKDRVTVLPVYRPLKRGDIVLFRSPDGRYVVHRIWKVIGGSIQTLGDHCPAPDTSIPEEKVYGLITEVKRGGRIIQLERPALQLYGRIWMWLFPLRKCFILGYRGLNRRVQRRYGGKDEDR